MSTCRPTKVVVTGASGFLGTHLVRALAGRPHLKIVGVSRQDVPGLCKVVDYRESPDGDVLVHLAEDSDRHKVMQAGAVYEEQAHVTLLALLKKGYRAVVYASSAVLYEDTNSQPRLCNHPLHVDDTYTRVKRQSELAVIATGSGVVVRLANLYGPGMAGSNVVSTIIRQIPGAGPLQVMDTAPVRDFLWVEDAVDGIAALATVSERWTGGVFNLGSGIATSIGMLARLALEVGGQPHRDVVAISPSGRHSSRVLDYSETTQACGWRPGTSLRAGLGHLLKTRQAGK